MTKVTYHKIGNEEWKAGDYATCCNCGAILKNYAKIGNEIYGLDCAATKLGKTEARIKSAWTNEMKQAQREAFLNWQQSRKGQ